MKAYLSSPSLLSKVEKGDPLSLYVSVTEETISAVLVKDVEGQQHPVYYVKRCLNNAETRYSLSEKLILSVVLARIRLKQYFEGNVISVQTNYPIKAILRKPDLSGRMNK